MRLLKPLLAAAAIVTAAVPALASAEPYWNGGGGEYANDRNYDQAMRADRIEAVHVRFLREREFQRERAFERARWEWSQHHDRAHGYWSGYRGW